MEKVRNQWGVHGWPSRLLTDGLPRVEQRIQMAVLLGEERGGHEHRDLMTVLGQ